MFETSSNHTSQIASEWLLRFSAAVREQEYAKGRELFALDVIAYGTFSVALEGLESLEANQWRHIWPATRNFSFDLDSVKCKGNSEFIWIGATWHSQGCCASGDWFDRHGRASFVLEQRDGKWVAIHSHHSISPTLNPNFPVHSPAL
jgi:ketosteroid isomerase-like protein